MKRMYNTKTFTEIYDSATAFTTDYSTIDLGGINDSSLVTKLYYLLYAKYGNSPIANLDETQFKYKLFSLIFQYGPNWEKELNIQGILRNLQLSDLVDDGNIHDILTHGASGSVNVSGTNGNTRTYDLENGASGTTGNTKTYDLETGASGASTNSRTFNESGTNTGTQATAHTGTVGASGSSTTSTDHDNSISNTGQFEDIKNHAENPATEPATNIYGPLPYINDQVANKNTSSGSQTVDESTETTGSNNSTTTYNNTDTTTNNLATGASGSSSDTGSTSNTETTDGTVTDAGTHSSTETTDGTVTDAGTNSSSTTSSDEAEDESTKTLTIGKLKGYERLLSLLNSNITAEFLKKFKPLFQQVVNPRVYLYESEYDYE